MARPGLGGEYGMTARAQEWRDREAGTPREEWERAVRELETAPRGMSFDVRLQLRGTEALLRLSVQGTPWLEARLDGRIFYRGRPPGTWEGMRALLQEALVKTILET